MPDYRNEPLDIYAEWQNCTRCELGVRRSALGAPMVVGEGAKRAIMLIGEGPGRNEEEQGRPFIGKSGELLREIIDAYKLSPYCYITNIVACRACEPVLDDLGQPKVRKRRNQPAEVMYRDVVPTPAQMGECSVRLYNEIYSVDPVVIVALGNTAASFLLGRPVSILKERGTTDHCEIPGATWVPQLTDKKKVWVRKVKGVEVMPIEQNKVRYLLIPTLHPAFVLRREGDHGKDSPWNQLASDIKLAGEVYERYMCELQHQEVLMNDVELNEDEVRKSNEQEDSE